MLKMIKMSNSGYLIHWLMQTHKYFNAVLYGLRIPVKQDTSLRSAISANLLNNVIFVIIINSQLIFCAPRFCSLYTKRKLRRIFI